MATGEVVVQRRKETDSAAEVPTGEYLDPEIVKRTRETLGQFVRRPPLTDKLLNKPPFRFLHDIITAVISTTGFMNGLYSEAELISDNVKERDTKIAFLQKAVDVVAMVTGRSLKMKPAKTVAGQEPEKTNEFLQALAEAITKKTVKNKEVPVGEKVLTGEKAKKKTIPKSKQVDSSGSASVMPDAVIGADESKVEKKKDESDVKEPANIVSKQPTVDKKEAAHVTRERKAEAKDATSAASKEKERRRVPAKKDDIAHRPGRVAGGGGGVAEGVKSPVRGRRPETKESRDVKRDKPETRKEKPESKPTSATVRHEAKPERHAKAGEHLEKGRKPTPTTVAKDSGGGAGTPGSTSGRTPRSEGAVKTRGEHQNRKPDGKERPMEKSVEKSMAHGKVETGIVGTKEVAANKPEMAANKPEMAAHKPEKAANKPEMAAHKPEVAAHKPEMAAHKPEMAAHKPEMAAHKPEKVAKQPDAKIVNSSGENARSLPKEKQPESQKTDAVDPQFKGSGNGKRIIQNAGTDGHKFDRPVLSAADAKADSVRPAAVPATDSHKTGSESTDKSENVNREDASKYGGKAPQVDKVKAIRPDTVKLNAKVREFAAEIEKPSASAGKAPVEPQQHHLHVHPPPAAAVVPNVTTKPAPHEQPTAQESVESKNERKARKDEKQRPANPQNRHATDLGNSDTRSEQERVTASISDDRRKSDRFSATLTRSEMTKTEGLQMNSHKLTPERENMEKETLADTNIQKPAYSRFESGISAIVDLNFPKISDDDDDDHDDDDDDDDDESDEDRFQERGVSNVIAVPGAFQDGSDDDTEHGGLVKKLLKTKKVHEDASISRKTKVEIDRSEMAFNAAKKRQQDQLMQDIAKLQSAIQSFTGNVMPLVMILEFLQEDLDSMKKEMDVWKVEIRTNTAALQQEQRLMESAVEPLQSLLSELEKEIVQQEAVNVALKSQALHNEERIRKMITSASRL